MLKSLPKEECLEVLDIGCGCGVFGIYFLIKLAEYLQKTKQSQLTPPVNVSITFADVDENSLINLQQNINILKKTSQAFDIIGKGSTKNKLAKDQMI